MTIRPIMSVCKPLTETIEMMSSTYGHKKRVNYFFVYGTA